jgi:hypothetical protein
VAGRLGHTDPSLTLRTYTHVIEERDGRRRHPRSSAELKPGVVGGSAGPTVSVARRSGRVSC